MKTSRILMVLCLSYLTQTAALAQQPSVALENIQNEYKSLAEVKPVMVNTGGTSIYLRPDECGKVRVSYIENGRWLDGDYTECPEINAIEIKGGEKYQFPSPALKFELGEGDFIEVTQGSPGKYRLTVSYSLSPTYRVGKPQMKRSISKEFNIVR